MKTTVVTLLLLLPSVATFAADTVNFKGHLSTQTCDITVDGSASPTIYLPTVAASEFAAPGSMVYTTPFTIMATNCPGNTSSTCSINPGGLRTSRALGGLDPCGDGSQLPPMGTSGEIKVNFVGNNVVSGGYLGNTASTQAATGVALVISKEYDQKIDLTGGWVSAPGEGITIPNIPQGQTGSAIARTFYVSYISTAATITPGKVRASMQYSMTYP